MKKETILDFIGEGASLTIYRELREKAYVYIYNHNETDFSDEGLDVYRNNEFTTFEAAFKLLKRYPLHYLYLAYCHPEYRDIVANEIVYKLNNDYEKVEPFFNNQDEFEQKLNVRFQFKKENTPSGFYYITIKSVFQNYQNESNSSQSEPTEPWLKNTVNECYTCDKYEGTIEILYNSILVKDNEGQLVKIYPSDKFIVELSSIYTSKSYWEIRD